MKEKGNIINRIKVSKNFTSIPNDFLKDNRISFKAKGIFMYIASLPPYWNLKVDNIIKSDTDGKASLRSGIKELEEFGYLRRWSNRTDSGFSGWMWELSCDSMPKNKAKRKLNKDDDSLCDARKGILGIDEWVKATRDNLIAVAPMQERVVFQSLSDEIRHGARIQEPFHVNNDRYFADIYLPILDTVIEVDGGYHNITKLKDDKRDLDLLSIGVKTIRVTNEQVDSGEFKKILSDFDPSIKFK